MFCPNCGKEMNDGASFCSNCGYKLKSSNNIKNVFNNVKDFANGVRLKFLKLDLKKRIIVVVSIIIVLLLLIILKGTVAKKDDLSIKIANAKMVSEYSTDTTIEEMDTVTFGSYPQSDVSGNSKEPIEWIILEKDEVNNRVLLLSKYILTCFNPYLYNQNFLDGDHWKESSLRLELNTMFYNMAFNEGEKSKIVKTYKKDGEYINNIENNKVIQPNDDKSDRVFILEKSDIVKFFTEYNNSDKRLLTSGTDYVQSITLNDIKLGDRYLLKDYKTISDGRINEYIELFDNTLVGIRPAIWVNINNDVLEKESKEDISGWIEKDGYWYYYDLNESMYKNMWIDNKYYVGADGIMLANTITPDGYYVSSTGLYDEKYILTTYALIKQSKSIWGRNGESIDESIFNANGDLFCRTYNNGAYYAEGYEIYFKNGDIYEANYSGSGRYYYEGFGDGDGSSNSGFKRNDINISEDEFNKAMNLFDANRLKNFYGYYIPIAIDNIDLKGWHLIGNYYCYFDDSGKMRFNSWIDGKYYVDSEGHMLVNTYTPDGYYVDYNGEYVKDINTTVIYLNGYYYLDGAKLVNAWIKYGNNSYYLDENGNIVRNKWIDGRYVGSSGAMYVGAMTPDGKYVNLDGYVVNDVNKDLKDSMKEKNVEGEAWYKTKAGLWYYFEKDRKTLRKGWFIDSRDNQTYYLDKDTGIMAVGWTEIDGSLYYFNESYENEPNWYEVGDGIYESFGKKVKSYGSMYKNETTPDGKQVDENGKLIETSVSNNISNANGDIIKFGNYMITSSENKDAIEWIVLDKQTGKTLLLSKYIIDCKCYNETRDKVTWETCSLRKWLNNDFYNAVFTNDEKNKILTTNLNQIDNPNNNKSKGGNPTNDKIFLLSIDEVQKYFNQHGLSPDNQNLAALPTEYAKSKDNNGEKLWVNNDSSVWHNGYGYFWLRSPGIYQRDAAGVDSNGGLDIEGRYVDVSVIGVRPAMWVSLE